MPLPTPEPPAPNAARPASTPDPWAALARFTPARIALGRAGASWRTETLLNFRLAHAQARDAVYHPFDPDTLAEQIQHAGFPTAQLSTQVGSRAEYLRRPDLGRKLSEESRVYLTEQAASWSGRNLAIFVSDGLSGLAAELQAVPVLAHLLPLLAKAGWSWCPIFVVPFARVKLQDEIGGLVGARFSLALLGERPGLGAPDSLGAYFTFQPGPDKTDADRTCLSNIRPLGLPPAEAAAKLAQLLLQSELQGVSGIKLKSCSVADRKLPA